MAENYDGARYKDVQARFWLAVNKQASEYTHWPAFEADGYKSAAFHRLANQLLRAVYYTIHRYSTPPHTELPTMEACAYELQLQLCRNNDYPPRVAGEVVSLLMQEAQKASIKPVSFRPDPAPDKTPAPSLISSPSGYHMEDQFRVTMQSLNHATRLLRKRHEKFIREMDSLGGAKEQRITIELFCKRNGFSVQDVLAQADAMLHALPETERASFQDWPILHTTVQSSKESQVKARQALDRHKVKDIAMAVCMADYQRYWARENSLILIGEQRGNGDSGALIDRCRARMQPVRDLTEAMLDLCEDTKQAREIGAMLNEHAHQLEIKFARYLAHLQLDAGRGNGYNPGHER